MILDFFIYVLKNSPLSTALIASHKYWQIKFHFYLYQNIFKVSWDIFFDSSVIKSVLYNCQIFSRIFLLSIYTLISMLFESRLWMLSILEVLFSSFSNLWCSFAPHCLFFNNFFFPLHTCKLVSQVWSLMAASLEVLTSRFLLSVVSFMIPCFLVI